MAAPRRQSLGLFRRRGSAWAVELVARQPDPEGGPAAARVAGIRGARLTGIARRLGRTECLKIGNERIGETVEVVTWRPVPIVTGRLVVDGGGPALDQSDHRRLGFELDVSAGHAIHNCGPNLFRGGGDCMNVVHLAGEVRDGCLEEAG